jgi:hypothetical protein
MLKLQYLIIYKNTGLPIYSRCFTDICAIQMKDEVLLSGFLSALTQSILPENQRELDFEDGTIQVDYKDGKLETVKFENLNLLFYYINLNDLIIAAGFPINDYKKSTNHPIIQAFFNSITEHITRENLGNADYYDSDNYIEMEKKLLANVLKPWMREHKVKDKCPLKNNCPYRIALHEESNVNKSITDRLRYTITRYSKMSFFRGIYLAIKQPKL